MTTINNEELDNLAMCIIYYSNVIKDYNAMDAAYLYIVLRDYYLNNESLTKERLEFLKTYEEQYNLIYTISEDNNIKIRFHDIETITTHYEKEA